MEDKPKKQPGATSWISLKNKRVLWIAIGCLSLIAILVFFMKTPKKHAAASKDIKIESDQKDLYSKAQIESLIKEKTLEEVEKKEARKTQQNVPGSKRKFNSPIAVFIKEELKQNPQEEIKQKEKTKNISTGVKVKAHLANAIFSFNVSSPVIAITDEDIKKDEIVLLPKNTQLVGDAGIVKSRDRVNIKFSTMILPNGEEIKVRAMALGADGSGGIKGKIDKQYDKSLLRAAGETVLAGASLVLGSRNGPISLQDELRLNAARNLTDDAHGALNDIKIEESITVEAYTPILVLFLEAV